MRARVAAGLLGVVIGLGPAWQAHADITNKATAGGTYNGQPVTSNTSSATVPLAPPVQALGIGVVSAGFDPNVAGGGELGAGDTLTFVVRVENQGNVTVGDVASSPVSIAFNGRAYTPANLSVEPSGPAKLAPGETRDFTFVYRLEADDVYSAAGVDNGVRSQWTANASGPLASTEVAPVSAQVTVAAAPALTIAKSFAISTDGGTKGSADVGDIITYTYVVTNTGNVALGDIHVVDAHESGEPQAATFDSSAYDGPLGTEPGQWSLAETTPAVFGANEDKTAGDAVFATLGVGGAVTFTYTHRVTQAEFDAQ